MKRHYGWVIVEVYKYKGKKERPISVRRNNTGEIGLSGYIYIYPTYVCAEIDRNAIRKEFFKSDFRIRKVVISKSKVGGGK